MAYLQKETSLVTTVLKHQNTENSGKFKESYQFTKGKLIKSVKTDGLSFFHILCSIGLPGIVVVAVKCQICTSASQTCKQKK
jgi:hypothetical protein